MTTFAKVAAATGLTLALVGCAGQPTSSLAGSANIPLVRSARQTVALPDGTQLGRREMPLFTRLHEFRPGLSGELQYGGGTVQTVPKVYVLYWRFSGQGDPKKAERTILDAFLSGVGGSLWLSTVTQYYDTVDGNITNPVGEYVKSKKHGFLDDNKTKIGIPTDADLQMEAMKLADKFGVSADASYVIATPHDHNTSGFGTQYCSYHGAFTYKGVVISYTDMPYVSDAGTQCGAGSVNNPGTYDGVSLVAGNELAESQTDPDLNNTGWGGVFGEIADICANNPNDPPINSTFSTGSFPTEALYSDTSSACSQTGPSGQ
jgi:hypothetical protein